MTDEWVDDENDHEHKVDLRLWKKLLRYTLHYRKTAIMFVFVALSLALSDLCFPLVTGKFIDTIAARQNEVTFDAFGRTRTVSTLSFFVGAYSFLSVWLCASIWCFIACAGKIRTHVSHDIRRDAFTQLQELSFSFYDRKPVGWLMARLTSDCQRLSVILAWGVMDFIWGSSLMTGISVVMLVYNWRLALAVLGVVPVLFAVSIFFRKRILRTSRLVRKANSKLTGSYNEGITGVRTSKVFVRAEQNLDEFDVLADDMYLHSVRNAVLSAVYLPLVLTLGSVAISSALITGGHSVIVGTLAVGELVMFMYYAQLFFQPVQEISAWFAELQMAQASAERVLSLIDAVPEVRDTPEVRQRLLDTGTDGHPDSLGHIEFRNVSFRYSPESQDVITDLSLDVQPGQTVALVGATGGGKSTLVNLLCRFYEPTAGEILIDGIEYRDRSLRWLQSSLGIVLQQPHLFSGTIGDNIRYGKLDATEDEVRAAAELAGAHEFISRLEDGYESTVGEGGNQLSLGEKQLVSFARAVLKQPRLLVMDEATSSIDTETEQLIQQGLRRMLADRTSFVIAHRLSTIRSADQILVIEKGRITEQGTHTELLTQRGTYYSLYTEQSLRDVVRAGELPG